MKTLPKRPPRLPEIFSDYDPPLYYVTMVAFDRQHLLAKESVHGAFKNHAVKQRSLNILIGRYMIMPDHIHLFICPGRDGSLGESVKHLKQAVTKAVRLVQPGIEVWQPGFFDHLMRNQEGYSEKWDYVRNNPVRAGLVEHADDWPYQGEINQIRRM